MAKGLKYLLLILLLGCAPKVTHRYYKVENPVDDWNPDQWITVEQFCSGLCDKYHDSTSVYLAHTDFYQCENDPHSICMIDCLKLPATDTTYCYQNLPAGKRSTDKP